MTIKFRCVKCDKVVEAPDKAAGQRGKCPYCGQKSYIPAPAADQDDGEIPLAPIDEAEERSRQEEIKALLAQERDLLHEMGRQPDVPLEHKEDLRSEDLYHFVVNYCLDMFSGNLERAESYVRKMKPFKYTAITAVEDFRTEKATETALSAIPKKVLKGFLTELKDKLK